MSAAQPSVGTLQRAHADTHGATASAGATGQGHGAAAHGGSHAGHAGEMHLPHGSWWPFWLAIGISLFGIAGIAMGRTLTLNDGRLPSQIITFPVAMGLLIVAFAFMVYTLIGWFVEDYKWWGQNVGTGTHIPKAGTLLFIGSEIFLFGALFATYLTFKNIGPEWPDGHVELPLLKTAIFSLFLFSSSYTIHKAEHAIKIGDRSTFLKWWWGTIALGAIFLGGQVNEYMNLIAEGHTLGSGNFMTAFFMLTGTHGLHVFAGLVFLTIVGIRAAKGQFTAERHAAPQSASMYWHFVDIVWVIVFSVIYLGEFWPF